MKNLIEYIVKNLVDKPESVQVIEKAFGEFQLIVSPSDLGRVIGKKGRIINSIRTILAAAAGPGINNVSLEILE